MKKGVGIALGFGAIALFALSFVLENIILFFIGIPVLLLGIFVIIFTMVVELYQKDKMIDYELIKKSGLTLVRCPHCDKENVLEDIYCIHCGERLDEDEV